MKFFIAQLLINNDLPEQDAGKDQLTQILNIALAIIGAIAFLMLVIAGLRYVTSQGQSEKVAEARKQIIYSFVGLVVAAMAAAIVNFVLGQV